MGFIDTLMDSAPLCPLAKKSAPSYNQRCPVVVVVGVFQAIQLKSSLLHEPFTGWFFLVIHKEGARHSEALCYYFD